MMQLLKQIWNERLSNGWLWAELLIVFVVLWYIVDWTYSTARTYFEPVGFDITDTYWVQLSLKDNKCDSYIPKEQKKTNFGQDLFELANRLRRLPEVEAVSISSNSRPYIGSNSGVGVYLDTLKCYPLRRLVTPEFFEVFRYESVDGQGYQPLVQALRNGNVVVSKNLWPNDYKGDKALLNKELIDMDDSTKVYKIGGVSEKVRYNDFWMNYGDRYMAVANLEAGFKDWDPDYYPSDIEMCLRVKPGTSANFSDYLMKISDSQLNVGNLFVLKVHNYADIRNDFQQSAVNNVKTRFWMIAFLLVNILLGIVGTFWLRTQHRRSELGLRVAVGSTRIGLWRHLNAEGVLLLTFAALPAAIICCNMGYMELVEKTKQWGILRFFIGIGITYLLMLLMILIGIWFPARQAIKIHPADALREE